MTRAGRVLVGRRGAAVSLLGLLLLARPAVAQVTIADQIVARQKVVAGTTTASSSPLTVVGLPGSGDILRLGAGGAVGIGPLVVGDIPSVFTRRDLNEAVAGLWTFGSNLTITGDLALNGGDLTATSGLTLTPGANVTLNPGGKIVLPGAPYAIDLGQITTKFRALHAAELWVETLVAQSTLATIGGRVLVGRTTTLTADLTASATSFSTKHNNLATGDTVYLEANGQFEVILITFGPAGAGPYDYLIDRNLDGSGANAWTAGDAVFNTGTTGTGWIDLYALSSMKGGTEAGPTIVGNVRTANTGVASANFNAWAPRWAVGNLVGLYGYATTTYGAAFGDPAAAWVGIDPAKVRLMYGATPRLTADSTGVTMPSNPAVSETWSPTNAYRFSGGASLTSGMAGWDTASGGSTVIEHTRNSGTAKVSLTARISSGLCGMTLNTLASGSATSVQVSRVSAACGGTVQPEVDFAIALGAATFRWDNIYLKLPQQVGYAGAASGGTPPSGFPYVVTGDAAAPTRLGYFCGITGQIYVGVPTSICPSGLMLQQWQCGITTGLACS